MYRLTAIFQKQPVAIAATVRSLILVAVLVGVVTVTEQQLAGIALAVELVLGLFVWNASTPVASPTLPSGTEVAIQGSEDTVIVQPSPPGPIGIEGEAQG